MTIELYHVKSIATHFESHVNVGFSWFVGNRPYPVFGLPYSELIANYHKLDGQSLFYTRDAIDELFVKEEADTLCGYLEAHHPDLGKPVVSKFNPPLESNIMGLGATPAGGGIDFLMLYRHPEYCLPFEVWGYFDLRQHEPLDKTRPPRRAFPSIVVRNGEMITEYDELLKLWESGTLSVPDWEERA